MVGTAGRGDAVTVVMTRSRQVLAAVGVMVVVVTTTLTNGCSGDSSDALAETIRARATELVAEAEQRGDLTVVGQDGWLFFAPELRHLSTTSYWGEAAAEVSQARNRDAVDPLPAILDFKRQLDLLNIELLVVPVPLKAVIFPDHLPGELSLPSPIPRLDAADAAFYTVLRDNGVEVLDLTRALLDNRLHPEGPVYCRTDTHWSGVGCVVAGQQIGGVVRARPWFAALETDAFPTRWYTASITGDLAPDGTREDLRLREVGSTDRPVPDADDSPIVLLGDSHNLVFHVGDDMHVSGAGLADQLAVELGMPVDVVAVRGAGATPARVNLLRRVQREPGYWNRKRLVIWCFSAREFTQSDGWSMVPVTP